MEEYKEDYLKPLITIQLGPNQMDSYALLDTGASRNIVSRELIDQLPSVERIEEQHCFRLANKGTVQSEFEAIVAIIVKGQEFKHKFHVLPYQQTTHPCILGVPWMMKHKVHVNVPTSSVYFKQASFHVHYM